MRREVYSAAALKRAAWHFLSGKAISALLTFAILLWLVRLLPVVEYGAYVVLIAATELGFAIATLGLPWLAARYVPEYRLNADGKALARLCRRLIQWQVLALLALAAACAVMLEAYLSWFSLFSYVAAAWLALGLLIIEGLGRFLREGLMAPLMLQGQARMSLIVRQTVFLAAIAALSVSGGASVSLIIALELLAAVIGWLAAHQALLRHIGGLQVQPVQAGWHEPQLAAQWGMALRMYAAHLVTLAYSPQVFLNFVQRTLGVEAAALFGFLRTLYDQIARYLPATLLYAVIRPKLMASYVSGGMKELARHVNLAGKMSLFVLLPLIAVVALGGDLLIALLSGNKFTNGGLLLLGLLLALLPLSQRQLIESVAVAADRPGLCTMASAASLLALPLMLALHEFGFGLWAPVFATIFGQVLFNAVVLAGLARLDYRPEWATAFKLAASAILAWLVSAWLPVGARAGSWLWMTAACALAVLFYLAAVWWLKPFSAAERERLNVLAGRRILPG